jgi:hypothetical protein
MIVHESIHHVLLLTVITAVLGDALDDLKGGGLSATVAHAVAYVVRATVQAAQAVSSSLQHDSAFTNPCMVVLHTEMHTCTELPLFCHFTDYA